MSQRGMVWIYLLSDPTGAPTCYLGMACDPRAWMKEHMSESGAPNSRKVQWLRMLKARGLRPRLRYIEKVKRAEARQIEADLIGIIKAIRGDDCVNKLTK